MTESLDAHIGLATRDRPNWEIRPGVRFPHWRAVRSTAAEEALVDILDLMHIEKCWTGYSGIEDKVRSLLLRQYGTTGTAPAVEALALKAGMTADAVRAVLASLRRRDLVIFDAPQDRIVGAYPFIERDTGHRVTLNGVTANATCAIDALGAGCMYGQDTIVVSRCRACDVPIRIETKAGGVVR